MGSTAALMQGLQSFDSSEAEGTRDGTGAAGLSTMLGSVAESFHSEDYDPVPPGGTGRWRRADATATDEDESSLFEEQEGDDLAQDSLPESDDEQLDRVHLAQASSPTAPTSSRVTSSSTRAASTSTAASSVPRRPATASAALFRLGETSADDSRADELTLDDDDSSREDRYGRAASRASASTSAGGKKKADSKAAGGGHMTLREQEKVRRLAWARRPRGSS